MILPYEEVGFYELLLKVVFNEFVFVISIMLGYEENFHPIA